MHRSFIALLIASAMVMTSLTAAPAEARNRGDTATAAAGVAVLALLAAAIAKRKRLDQRDIIAREDDGYQDQPDLRHSARGSQASSLSAMRGVDDGDRQSGHVQLPGACRVGNPHRAGYSGRCLERHDYDHAALPSACSVQVGGRHGTIYRDRCLNGYGYY